MPRMSNQGRNSGSSGAIANLINEIRGAYQLFRDPRVPTYAKALPGLLVLIYILFPVDLMPDPILGLGQLDDLGVFFLGMAVFRALVPNYIVQEYSKGQKNATNGPQEGGRKEEDYIDAEYRVLHDDE